ncbi:MAG: glycosyltransferase [Candidatus Paceibacterota bacterium]|jgi:hypothetical protein
MDTVRAGYVGAYYRKLTKRFFGVVHLRARGQKKGAVLLSFITSPFTLLPSKTHTDPHPNYWACMEIARLLLVRGYDVDIIEWTDKTFVPKKRYAACIDLQQNLERLSPLLGPECRKVAHLVSSYPGFQNSAEAARIAALEKRRGVKFPMKRPEEPSNNPRFADYLEGYGNKTVHDTYKQFNKKIYQIHVGSSDTYDFPEKKDFAETRKHFLWFGGGGAVLKGLDLVIEAFAGLPQFTLTIIGPAAYEREFEKVYAKELVLPNIRRYPRPKITADNKIEVEGRDILEFFNECAATIFLSASEGAGASVVQTLHAGLIPIITPNSGIDERVGGIILTNPTVESVQRAVTDFSLLSPDKIKSMAREGWSFARENYTREAFTKNYSGFIDNVLKL